MRLTVPHYYDFGPDRGRIGRDLVRPQAWDAARETEGPFGLPATREAWERRSEGEDVRSRAGDIARIVEDFGAASLCSYGVGTAVLELALSRLLPAVRLTCTDYAPRTVERLRALFPEAEVVVHDLRADDPVGADFQLLHRLDSELSRDDWRRVLARLTAPVLFVPTVVLTTIGALEELARPLVRRGSTRAGWARNEDALRDLWRPTHGDRRLTVGGAPAYLLTRR